MRGWGERVMRGGMEGDKEGWRGMRGEFRV